MWESRAADPFSTDAGARAVANNPLMYAGTVEDAEIRLHDLRREEWADLALALVALALALAATRYARSLALPLEIGGLAVGALGIRALWRHWDLVDRLADEPDAYAIAEVVAYASRESTMDRRRRSAAFLRRQLEPTRPSRPACVDGAAEELAALAAELEDAALELSPASAMLCSRLVNEPAESPLLNPALPQDGLRSTVLRIRSGFTRRQQL